MIQFIFRILLNIIKKTSISPLLFTTEFIIFEVVQAKLFEHQIIENNLYNNGQRIRNCKLFYCTIFIMLSNNSFLSAKIRFFYKFLKFNFKFLLKQILSLPISSLKIKFSLLDGIAYPFES